MRLVRRAGGGVPKSRIAIVEGLIARGHSSRSACRITGLGRSTWQASRRRPLSTRAVRRIIVAAEVESIHRRSHGIYGKRRLRAALFEEHDMIVNLKLISAIMRKRGLA